MYFRHSVPKSFLNSIHYVKEIIFELISQENNITIAVYTLDGLLQITFSSSDSHVRTVLGSCSNLHI